VLAVAAGPRDTVAAPGVGRRSGDAVATVVTRFNREGRAVIVPGQGGGARVGSGGQERERIRTAAHRTPDAARDGIAPGSLTRLTVRVSLPADPPPVRMLLVRDTRVGHPPPAFVVWLVAQGIMPLSTPLGGRWVKLTESLPRLRTRCALHGQHPTQPGQISDAVEATAEGWNRAATPFVWGGRRAARRARARARCHTAGGSGARALRPIGRRETITEHWRDA